MKLVLVTPYNTTNGQLLPQIARSDIATAAAGSFTYLGGPGGHDLITVSATHCTLVGGLSLFVKESVASLIAAS